MAVGSGFLKPVLARSPVLAGKRDEAPSVWAGAEEGWPHPAATVHLALGEEERALERLSTAADRRDPWILLVSIDPMLKPPHA